MSDIKVNKFVWNAISEVDKEHIVTHLRQYGVLKSDEFILADADTAFPDVRQHNHGSDVEKFENAKALGLDWICRAICDSSNSEKNCALYGQSLSSCLDTISVSRQLSHAGS